LPLAYKAPSKYPAVQRDVSALLPVAVTVEQVREELKALDPHILAIALVDMFKKDDWLDQKSLTFGVTLQAPDKTLTSAEADAIMAKVADRLRALGGQVR
jgi:phenylalanyl-tRNA synthetase beta subunit